MVRTIEHATLAFMQKYVGLINDKISSNFQQTGSITSQRHFLNYCEYLFCSLLKIVFHSLSFFLN